MRLLFVGDVVGKPGRRILKNHLRGLIESEAIDFTIVNGENAAHGKGITLKLYNELISAGADAVTLGNHSFAKSEILHEIDNCDYLIRPANLIPTDFGNSTLLFDVKGKKIAVSSIMGEVFMNNIASSPYDAMIQKIDDIECDLHIVDFHAEATGEKQTFLHLFKTQVAAIIGTHTHVQTADERVVEGCAYISDVGMTGVIDSILGRDIQEVINRTVYQQSTNYTIATGRAMLNAVVVEFDQHRSVSIKRIKIEE